MKLPKLNNGLGMGFICLLLSGLMMAQVKTETTTTQGQPSVETKVERGEVVNVSGNDLVVKMENGEIRNFSNVPESTKVTVNGQQLSIHELKPGMKLERTITTTTTPQTVTTVKTVKGKVFMVVPPTSLILTLEDGTRQQFKIPEGQKFKVDDREIDAFGLQKGMKITATKIVTAPETLATVETKVTGEMPPTEAIQGPLLIQSEAEKPAEVAQAQPAPTKLPQTASELPLIGVIGVLVLLSGVVLLAAGSRPH